MAWSTAEEKKSLRAQVRRALEGLSPREREESDRLIQMRRRSGRWRGGEHMPPLDGEV